MPSADKPEIELLSFWQFFRIVFVLFSLFLMGDAFYRWDGFKFYATFSEYIPSLALASILWSMIAISTAYLVWLPLKAFEKFCKHIRLKIDVAQLLMYSIVLAIMVTLLWIIKKSIWADSQSSLQFKLIIMILVSCVAALLVWPFRNKAKHFINAVQERISPLVWLFGIFVILSVPLVAYHTLGKNGPEKFIQSTVSKSNEKQPNIILVTFDALTARNMSLYGYDRKTTPYIDTWAERASVFTRTEAESNYTSPTTASLMTGKRVWTHRRYPQETPTPPVNGKTENLALLLKENGYSNYAFIQNQIASVEYLGIADSFDFATRASNFVKVASIGGFIDKQLDQVFGGKFQIYNWLGQDDFIFSSFLSKFPHKSYITEYPPEMVFNRFLETVNNNTHRPFFAWIHLFPPHDPYLPPEQYAGTYNPTSEMREKNIQFNFKRHEYRLFQRNAHPQPEEFRRKANILRDYYDEFILYCDRQFEDFIENLKNRDLLENTIIILSADHGESFDHDYFAHGGPHLYEQVTHIPLIIKEPGQTDGLVLDNLVEQVDIPATILDLADIPVPAWMEGRSLLPLLKGSNIPKAPVLAMALIKNKSNEPVTKGTIALWKGDYKLIHYLEEEKSLLFNLSEDPKELINLFDRDKERGNKMLSLLRNYLEETNKNFMKAE